MANPEFYTRIKNKIDTNTNYKNKNSKFLAGELIGVTGVSVTVDGTNKTYNKLKVADGSSNYNNLQFVDQEAIDRATAAQTKANSAYDFAAEAKGNAAAAYSLAESKVGSLSDLGITATATELNYVDGVTSAIQTQLNGKLSTSGTAAKATADASGNNIVNTYATKTELNNSKYTLPAATSSTLGGVKTGSNITNSSGTISLTKSNVTSALGYTPPTTDTNTTYTFATGDSNGQIKITPSSGSATNVSVKGLGSAAYTASTAYASSSHTHDDRYFTEDESKAKFFSWDRGAFNLNTLYDAKVYMQASGTNAPSGSQYGVVLGLPYRKFDGNTIPDFGAQIFIPNGDDATHPNSMFYRTSLGSTWNDWQEVMPKSGGIFTGEVSINRNMDGVDYRIEIYPYRANIGDMDKTGSLQLWYNGEETCDSILMFNHNGLALKDNINNKTLYYLHNNDKTHTKTYHARMDNRAITYAGEIVNSSVRTSAGAAATTGMLIFKRK